ncbi:DUF1289 domain-containing protein [Melioribacteraceae bacterium 4301-Me]|uniref:DUF1289 domain-containing protein n=1 Tax=Pyranulibacter aquaticus TaxID=3163344 RepID=UPI00359AFA28
MKNKKTLEIESPCNGNCTIDIITKYCIGCFRTIEEIIAWPSLSKEKRKEIIKLIEIRKKQLRKSTNQNE